MTARILATVGGSVYTGEKWRTTLMLDGSLSIAPPTPAELSSLVTLIRNTFNTNVWSAGASGLRTFNSNTTTLDYASARVWSNGVATPVGFYENTFAAVAGSGGANLLPPSAAVVASKRSDLATRHGRGRAYLPLTSVALEAASGQIPDATCSSIATWYAAYCSAMNAATFTLGGISQFYEAVVDGPYSPTNQFGNAITHIIVNSNVDRQVGRQRDAVSQFQASQPVV